MVMLDGTEILTDRILIDAAVMYVEVICTTWNQTDNSSSLQLFVAAVLKFDW